MPEPTIRIEIPNDIGLYESGAVTISVSDGKGGFRQLTPEECVEHKRKEALEHKTHVREKGHDCWDFVEHSTFWNGRKHQDTYDCSLCGDNLQVG